MAKPGNEADLLNDAGKTSASIKTSDQRQPYKNYFSVVEHDISIPRFYGGYSPVVTRAVFVSGDAIAVLPYDPVRDRVLLIEQFRFGPHVHGDKNPWKFEAIAGRIDAGETPEQTAHRETREETGLQLHKLLPIAGYYPAPGAVAEFMHTYIGLADLPDAVAGVGGLEDEAEDIKSHVLSYRDAMKMFASGKLDTGPLVTCLLWLALQRDQIRNDA